MVEVSEENFQQHVLDESQRRPVLVDFWADWCQPCKALGPVLEKAEKEYGGKFLLAKVDTEKHKNLAQHFQIQSIPAVKLFSQGQLVDEFTGALPEDRVKEFLDKYIPNEKILAAHQLAQGGDWAGVIELITRENLKGDKVDVLLWNAAIFSLVAEANAARTLEILQMIPISGSKFSQDKENMTRFLQSEPSKESMRHFQLMFDQAQTETGLAYFMKQVEEKAPKREKKKEDFEKVKGELIACFAVLGATHPLVMDYRRRLSTLLF